MIEQRTTTSDERRLQRLERDIAKAEEREEERRREETEPDYHFATPEAYEAEQMARRDAREARDDRNGPDPMEQPTPSRMGNVGHAMLEDDEDDKSESQRSLERVAKLSNS